MDTQAIGDLICRMRREHGMTQAQLGRLLHVSSKAVSKWERHAGCPDVSLMPALAQALGISMESLMTGGMSANRKDNGSMKRISIYQCPVCGNLLTSTAAADIACCGRRMAPLAPQPADEAHQLVITPMEDEWHVAFAHPMEKAHHLSFILEVGYDRFVLLRLYPEGACEARLPRLPGGKFFCGCVQHGLFAQKNPGTRPGRNG